MPTIAYLNPSGRVIGLLDRNHGYVDEPTVFDDETNSRFFIR
ncbi:hypothetical protein [Trinickia fusca]|nr:hypothetical protein [Trinickia fusca]